MNYTIETTKRLSLLAQLLKEVWLNAAGDDLMKNQDPKRVNTYLKWLIKHVWSNIVTINPVTKQIYRNEKKLPQYAQFCAKIAQWFLDFISLEEIQKTAEDTLSSNKFDI